MSRMILVEDDELIGTMVKLNLEQEGHSVEWHRTGAPVLSKVRTVDSDLIILDIMLPDADGVEIARKLRGLSVTTPILMMTAKSDVDTKIAAFDLGADDYITKPFDMKELLARVRALIRRSVGERHHPTAEKIPVGAFWVNLGTRAAMTRDGEIRLSSKEADLLSFFLRNEGVARSRADILEEVWGMEVYVSERTIDNFIVRFRKLFEDDPDNPQRFITVRGVGYRYDR